MTYLQRQGNSTEGGNWLVEADKAPQICRWTQFGPSNDQFESKNSHVVFQAPLTSEKV